jgi:hypothetical protein
MIDFKITKLSVLARAAQAYAEHDLSGIRESAGTLYPDGRYPFAILPEYPLPLHLFSPRLSAMLIKDENHLNALDMWNLITTRENILRMITATEIERTAAESLGKLFEARYAADTTAQLMKRKQMIGYMIKVAMECFGYLTFSSRVQVSTIRTGADPEKRKSNYFTTATRYALMSTEIRDTLLSMIPTVHQDAFRGITDYILGLQQDYQKQYDIDAFGNWGTKPGVI